MAIPDFQTLMLPALRLLAQRPQRLAELTERLAEEFALSAEDRAELLPSGRQSRLANRVGWAVTYLHKAGLVRRVARAEYEVTEAGGALLAAPPQKITVRLLEERFPEFREFRARSNEEQDTTAQAAGATTVPPLTPDDVLDGALDAINANVRAELHRRLLEGSPAFFERVVIDLLLALGYGSSVEDAAQALGGTGDGGVDGVIREDRLGLDLIYVQAKRYRDAPVGANELRSFAGALDDKGARKGVFMTTSRFTAEAVQFAERQQMKRIVLIDGERLTRLMLRHDVGVRPTRTIVLKRVDADYFEPEEPV
jgi:restriction system protein